VILKGSSLRRPLSQPAKNHRVRGTLHANPGKIIIKLVS
jgi:hypothetical protein